MSPLTERAGGRSATPVKKGASLASLSNANLTLHEIIQPHMPWKDSMSFLFGKGWTYITGDGLTEFFYVATVRAVEEEGGNEYWGVWDGLLRWGPAEELMLEGVWMEGGRSSWY